MTLPEYCPKRIRYRGQAILGLREGARLLLLCAVVYFAADFCLSRLLIDAGWLRMLITGLISLGALVLPAAFLMSAHGVSWDTVMGRELGAGKGFWIALTAVFGLIASLGLQMLWMLLLQALGQGALIRGQGLPQAPIVWQILVGGAVAAFAEEILMRGILLPAFERRIGRMGAVIVTAALFAFLHGDLVKIPVTFLLGLYLAQLTVRAGTVKASIVYHFTHNTLSLLIAHWAGQAAGEAAGGAASLPQGNAAVIVAMMAAAAVILGGLLMALFYRTFARRCPKESPELFREGSPLGIGTVLSMLLALGFIGLRILCHAVGVFG